MLLLEIIYILLGSLGTRVRTERRIISRAGTRATKSVEAGAETRIGANVVNGPGARVVTQRTRKKGVIVGSGQGARARVGTREETTTVSVGTGVLVTKSKS
jgi:hypothetical protein